MFDDAVLAEVLFQQRRLPEAERACRDALVAYSKTEGIGGAGYTRTAECLINTLLAEHKLTEAETLARKGLALREKEMPDDWGTFNARSMLGGALLGQKKYTEAEPLLLSACEGMKLREDQIPPLGKPRLKEALQRLVQLYQETHRPEQAAEWKQRLAEFEKTEAQR